MIKTFPAPMPPSSSRLATRTQIEFWRDARLPMIEGRRTLDSAVCYRAHTHPTLSVGIVDLGESLFELGSVRRRLRSGDVVVIAPSQVHACNPRFDRRWSYRMFYFDAAWSRLVVASRVASGWPQGVIRHPRARLAVDEMEKLLRRGGPAETRQSDLRSCLARLFDLCPHRTAPDLLPRESDTFRAVRDYLDAHCLEPVPLVHLARMAGLSPFRLIRRFRTLFGLTPHAYQLDRRVNHARRLLHAGHAPADVAYATGFSDQSHFQRAFKPRVAATPAEYRRGGQLTTRRSR